MTRQMSAERTRRAAITEAQGQKQAAITVAEGAKEAAILDAEGEKQAAILKAEGLAQALERIRSVGGGLDANTMQLQYLDTLKQVGMSPSTKIVVPMELGGLLNGLKGLLPTDAAVPTVAAVPPAPAPLTPEHTAAASPPAMVNASNGASGLSANDSTPASD
jgi:regulator of protease activity HflC (stomatin/prohibitin superfamily)